MGVSGAKNSALALFAGALIAGGPVKLRNVPVELKDVIRMADVLRDIGLDVEVGVDGPKTVVIVPPPKSHLNPAPNEKLVSALRASFFVIGPLLARCGEAVVPLPGGCDIGARPVDLHLRGLAALGADVRLEAGAAVASAPRGLVGARIYMDYPSVGATETLIMAACVADGETVIENAAQEPEVVDLANLLNACGARVSGAGSARICVTGVPPSKLTGCEHTVIPDRIEAGTLLAAGAITHSTVSLSPVVPGHLAAVIAKLHAVGCRVTCADSGNPADPFAMTPTRLTLHPASRLRATDVKTLPYPGFPTDMQAQFTALLTQCEGASTVHETVFENRMKHVRELQRMGAQITIHGADVATVSGHDARAASTADKEDGAPGELVVVSGLGPNARQALQGALVRASDLRAGAALILAALAAEGTTTLASMAQVDRGYESLDLKLLSLGADVRRVEAVE